jgi:predicted nuclease of predicted toxin-antitoxin system
MSSLNPPKLHLNENMSPRLANELRRYGFDVTSSQEADMLATPDDEQLAFAAAAQRAIVTFNIGDFSLLHEDYQATGREHWGIVLSNRETIGVLLHRLLRLLNSLTADDLRNSIYWLNDFK